MKESLLGILSKHLIQTPELEAKPRISPQCEEKQIHLNCVSQSQRTILSDLLNHWMMFDSTHLTNCSSEKSAIKKFRSKLEKHQSLRKLLEQNKRTGEHFLFEYINQCQAEKKDKELQEILALYLDARHETNTELKIS